MPVNMKEAELRQHATCTICRKKVGATGLPLFWRVTIDRFGIDLQAARRQDGLAAYIGSAAIAQIMGPDLDMAKPVMDTAVATICEHCACMKALPIAAIAEAATPEPQPAAGEPA